MNPFDRVQSLTHLMAATRLTAAAETAETAETAEAEQKTVETELEEMKRIIGGHIRLDPGISGELTSRLLADTMFQCFLTNTHGHFAESRVQAWTESGIRFADSAAKAAKAAKAVGEVKRIAHASYVTVPWSSSEETRAKSVMDIDIASRCVNLLGMWGLVVHLPKEYHLSRGFEQRVEQCLRACQPPCCLLFELTGNSTSLVTRGQLPQLPIERIRQCQEVIERVAAATNIDDRWGFCFDTAHAFVQYQPLTTAADARSLIEAIESPAAASAAASAASAAASAKPLRIMAIHLNGSKHPFGSGRDQHEPAGSPFDHIWGRDSSGLAVLVEWIMRRRIPTVLEVPGNSLPSQYCLLLQRLHSLSSPAAASASPAAASE